MALLLVQMTAVLLTTLLCGWMARRLGRARVIGEIIGGILIGPSAFGRVAPHASAMLFPPASLGSFEVLSTVGLILFLFLIGSELDYKHLRQQKRTTVLASSMSILFPFAMAAIAAHSLRARFSPNATGGVPFVLFLGISMSITAVPVLIRILEERQLLQTPLGTTALVCAAVSDVFAWIVLAIALALIPQAGEATLLSYRLLGLCVYLAVMLCVVRPLGKWLVKRRMVMGLSYELLGISVAFVLASAAATEAIGVHPLFGAFMAFTVIDPGKDIDILVLVPDHLLLGFGRDFNLTTGDEGIGFGGDCEFLGFPYGGGWKTQMANPKLPGTNTWMWLPFVKHCTVSAQLQEKGHGIWVLDGINNEGFSGGPVLFATGRSQKVFAVISGFHQEPLEVLPAPPSGQEQTSSIPPSPKLPGGKSKKPEKGVVNANSGFIIAFDIDPAIKAIQGNPIGPLLPEAISK